MGYYIVSTRRRRRNDPASRVRAAIDAPGIAVSCVREALERYVARSKTKGSSELAVMQAVIDYGKPFIGIERPKGYRHQRRIKECYSNAGDKVLSQGHSPPWYVEGFILPGLIQHAWLTLDGVHAVDQTLHAPDNEYFGIVFTVRAVVEATGRRGYWEPLLQAHDLSEVLSDLSPPCRTEFPLPVGTH